MENKLISYTYYQTAAGILKVVLRDKQVREAVFITDTHAETIQPVSMLPEQVIVMDGTEFQKKVWQAAVQIPAGSTMTYQEIACVIGNPKAVRAVGRALGQNKIAYLIPCHRVMQKNGKLGGYKWGLAKKEALLKAENSL